HISLTQTSHTPPNSSPIPHHAPLPPLPLHSFPTRRSSDLPRRRRCRCARSRAHGRPLAGPASSRALPAGTPCSTGSPLRPRAAPSRRGAQPTPSPELPAATGGRRLRRLRQGTAGERWLPPTGKQVDGRVLRVVHPDASSSAPFQVLAILS